MVGMGIAHPRTTNGRPYGKTIRLDRIHPFLRSATNPSVFSPGAKIHLPLHRGGWMAGRGPFVRHNIFGWNCRGDAYPATCFRVVRLAYIALSQSSCTAVQMVTAVPATPS